MKRIYIIIPIILFCMIYLSSCGKPKQSEAADKQSVQTFIPSFQVLNTPDSNFEFLSVNTIYEANDKFKVDVRYPSTASEVVNNDIDNLIYSYIDNYKQRLINSEELINLNINYDIIEHSDSIISFKFNITDLVNSKSDIKVLTFDLDNQKLLTLGDIFKADLDYISVISKKIPIDILSRHIIINEDLFEFAMDKENLILYLKSNEDINIDSFEIHLKDIINDLSALITLNKDLENKKLIALTFDDGPNPLTTPILLDGLAERNIKATFFMLGSRIEQNPDIIKRIYQDGHCIGNHSYSHKNLVKLDETNAKYEYGRPNEILTSIIGTGSTVFRPPYGNINDSIKSFVDTPVILWNIDPYDWKYKNSDTIANHIIERAKDGDIILLHDIYQTSVEAALKVIDDLIQKDFEFVTIDELIRRNGNEPAIGKVIRYEEKI